jgi:hypothetical protein
MSRHKQGNGLYNANLVKASLKVPESRIIAGLLLDGVDAAAWHRAIVVDNVLQTRSPYTARTFASFIGHRLRTLEPAAWAMVRDGSTEVATQTVLAATIRYSRLLGDFLEHVLKDRHRRFELNITARDWSEFIEGCQARDPNVDCWTEGVIMKLRQNIFRIVAEAGYVTDTNSMTIQHVAVLPEVVDLLNRLSDNETLSAMRATE